MFWRRFSQFQRRVQFSFVTRETLKTQFGSKKRSIERKKRRKKSHTFQIKKIDLISLFTYFQLQSLKALLAKTIILLKLKTFFEISKPYCFTLMGERSTKSTASTTSSMKGKNRKTDRTESHTSSRTTDSTATCHCPQGDAMCYDQLLRVGSRTLAYARETETYLLVFLLHSASRSTNYCVKLSFLCT